MSDSYNIGKSRGIQDIPDGEIVDSMGYRDGSCHPNEDGRAFSGFSERNLPPPPRHLIDEDRSVDLDREQYAFYSVSRHKSMKSLWTWTLMSCSTACREQVIERKGRCDHRLCP